MGNLKCIFKDTQGVYVFPSPSFTHGSLLLSRSVVSDSLWPHGTVAPQAPLSMGFSRQEYWSGLLFSSPWIASHITMVHLSNLRHWHWYMTVSLTPDFHHLVKAVFSRVLLGKAISPFPYTPFWQQVTTSSLLSSGETGVKPHFLKELLLLSHFSRVQLCAAP